MQRFKPFEREVDPPFHRLPKHERDRRTSRVDQFEEVTRDKTFATRERRYKRGEGFGIRAYHQFKKADKQKVASDRKREIDRAAQTAVDTGIIVPLSREVQVTGTKRKNSSTLRELKKEGNKRPIEPKLVSWSPSI